MKKMKKFIALLLCLAVLASIFTVTAFAEEASSGTLPTIPELIGTIISWRFRPLFWLANFFIRLVTGLPLFPGLE
ncbi:MAG: hypothetical protein K5756_01650 [Clostridiales bacterium]|nr:hypothetical protein [Clostridiales bacterium]